MALEVQSDRAAQLVWYISFEDIECWNKCRQTVQQRQAHPGPPCRCVSLYKATMTGAWKLHSNNSIQSNHIPKAPPESTTIGVHLLIQ